MHHDASTQRCQGRTDLVPQTQRRRADQHITPLNQVARHSFLQYVGGRNHGIGRQGPVVRHSPQPFRIAGGRLDQGVGAGNKRASKVRIEAVLKNSARWYFAQYTISIGLVANIANTATAGQPGVIGYVALRVHAADVVCSSLCCQTAGQGAYLNSLRTRRIVKYLR